MTPEPYSSLTSPSKAPTRIVNVSLFILVVAAWAAGHWPPYSNLIIGFATFIGCVGAGLAYFVARKLAAPAGQACDENQSSVPAGLVECPVAIDDSKAVADGLFVEHADRNWLGILDQVSHVSLIGPDHYSVIISPKEKYSVTIGIVTINVNGESTEIKLKSNDFSIENGLNVAHFIPSAFAEEKIPDDRFRNFIMN